MIRSDAAESTLELFNKTGAYLKGHFRLTSGLHSPEYLQCALVLSHPPYAAQFGAELARKLHALAGGEQIDIVVAPAIGGLIIGHEVARALEARFLFTERDSSGKMTLRRGFEIDAGERAVVVEDVITTGGSLREVVELVKAGRAKVAAAGSIIDRSGGTVDLGMKRVALATLEATTYTEDLCPMCKLGQPLVKPGSRPA